MLGLSSSLLMTALPWSSNSEMGVLEQREMTRKQTKLYMNKLTLFFSEMVRIDQFFQK